MRTEKLDWWLQNIETPIEWKEGSFNLFPLSCQYWTFAKEPLIVKGKKNGSRNYVSIFEHLSGYSWVNFAGSMILNTFQTYTPVAAEAWWIFRVEFFISSKIKRHGRIMILHPLNSAITYRYCNGIKRLSAGKSIPQKLAPFLKLSAKDKRKLSN